ncbi:alpha/beta-hydrolase [Gloeophyllum trabeum ATCC 11539]|uniref:Alpha/beta-hydrolase n=1 Tax=Gloeophyllum trabeum (strain ATCC 11539 / FP-39264 / Madison 617) TaxID=670483 RepID=S7PV35_GLOTA|nr:alpha/beta-hydrolase [Gloeophyllum trabeum ATCC 11539]EPQ51252.1 alpha/beta-hydrolase [Gloeophyllum trabeum ATCC 11539]
MTSLNGLECETVVLQYNLSTASAGLGDVLRVEAKRYRPSANAFTSSSGWRDVGVTLLLMHGAGSHKEQWEPTIQRIHEATAGRKAHGHGSFSQDQSTIREIWTFDWPNHGNSSVLNEDHFSSRLPSKITVRDIGHFLATFVKSRHFQGHRIIPVGHSAGTCAAIFSVSHFPPSHVPYESLILIELPCITDDVYRSSKSTVSDSGFQYEYDRRADILRRRIEGGRSRWSSKSAVFEWTSKRLPWSRWDSQVLDLYLEYGFRESSSTEEAAAGRPSVTPKCTRVTEAASQTDTVAYREAANMLLNQIMPHVPVHLIFGRDEDIVPKWVQDSMIDGGAGLWASVHGMDGVGHLVVQEDPRGLAQLIVKDLKEGLLLSMPQYGARL